MNSSQAFCVTHDARILLGGGRQHLRLHEARELAGEHHEERPAGEATDLGEADAAPTEVGPKLQPRATPEEEQDAPPARRSRAVAVPPITATIVGRPVRDLAAPPEQGMKIMNPAIETTLLTIGAHVYGPNTRRAFRASPTSAYRP